MPVPTPRLLLAAALGAVAAVLTASHDVALVAVIVWLAGAAIAGVIDARFAPGPKDLHWARMHENTLSLGTWNAVDIVVRNRTTRDVRLRVRDAVPRLMSSENAIHSGTVAAGAEWIVRYRVYPIHRGDFVLGPLVVRTLGPLGLAWREYSPCDNEDVRVYPNTLAIRQYEALLRSGRLFELGFHRNRRRGEGSEFERLRLYTPDDEFRRIDWKATARRGSPIVAETQSERSQSILFALDVGRLMTMRVTLPDTQDVDAAPGGTPPLTRLDYSLNATLLLAYVAQSYGDRIGVIAFADQVTRFLPPRSGRRQFVALTETLYNLEAEATETDFVGAAAYVQTRLSRRSLVVFFTDVIDPESSRNLIAQIALLGRRHLALIVTLQDPDIRRLASQSIDGSRSVYERTVAQRVLEERNLTLAELRKRGALTLDVSADQISAGVINQYLDIKSRGRL